MGARKSQQARARTDARKARHRAGLRIAGRIRRLDRRTPERLKAAPEDGRTYLADRLARVRAGLMAMSRAS